MQKKSTPPASGAQHDQSPDSKVRYPASDRDVDLQEWRHNILRIFTAILLGVVMILLFTAIVRGYSRPGIKVFEISLGISGLILLALLVFRPIHFRIRIGVILLLVYFMVAINLRYSGILFLTPYLLLISIFVLVMMGKEAGIIISSINGLMLGTAVVLVEYKGIDPGYSFYSLTFLVSALAFLLIIMGLLLLFNRFLENMIGKERHIRAELEKAREQLEEHNAQLEGVIEERTEELQQGNKVLAAANQIAGAAGEARDIQDFFRRIHSILDGVVYAKNLFIALYDETTGMLSFPYFVDEKDPPLPPIPLKEARGFTSYMVRSGHAIHHGSGQLEDLVKAGQITWVGSPNQDGMGMPLKLEGKGIGALYVQSYTQGIVYSDQDEEILFSLAPHIATALTRFRALESERQHTIELEIINSVQSAVAVETDLQPVYEMIGAKLLKVFEGSNLAITLYDEASDRVEYPYVVENGIRLNIPPQPLRPGGIVHQALMSSGSGCLRYGGEADASTLPGTLAGKSGLAVPIIGSKHNLGALQLENLDQFNAYSESDARLLSTIAAALGMALENGRLSIQKNEAIEALRQSEERLQKIVHNLPQYISIFDFDLNCSYVSSPVYRSTGYTPEERVALKVTDYVTPESLAMLALELQTALAEEQSQDRDPNRVLVREVEEIRKDGSHCIFESTYTFLRDDEGNPTSVLAISTDITDRKRAERELKRSNDKLNLAMSIAQLAFWEMDPVSNEFHFNDQFYNLYQTTVEREGGYNMPVSTFIQKYLHPEDAIAVGGHIRAFFDPRSTLNASIDEQRAYRSDGELRHQMVHVLAERDAQGTITKVFGVTQDVTDQKRTEQALRESERRQADIINFLPIPTLVIDQQSKVTAWNHAMEELTGVKAADMLGKGDFEYAIPFYGRRTPILIDLLTRPPDQLVNYRNVERHGDILAAEAFASQLGPTGRVLQGFACLLHDADGKTNGAIESLRDISQVRAAEAALKDAKESAETANRAKSIFLANMSHEIRTPMNAILGFTQLMQRDPHLTNNQRERLDVISRSSEHLLALINDILELSKIEAGRVVFTPQTFDLHQLLDDMETMFRVRAKDKKLWLTVEMMDTVPRWVVSDEGKLRQVLINLIGNAVKFTQEGGIAVRIGAQPLPDGRRDLVFEVEDTGPGMTPEELGRLFKAFEQTSAGVKIGGTGLGLALSQGFVQMMGGNIAVSSSTGKGSTFRFNILVEEGQAAYMEPAPQRKVLRLKPGHAEVRALVADDRETNRQFLTQLLAGLGFSVKEAEDGAEALAVNASWAPQVILMDMNMPVMTGYEATRRIKTTQDGHHPVVIAVTASAFEEDRQEVMSVGADGFLSKPFKEADLFEQLSQLVGVEFQYEEEITAPVTLEMDAAGMLQNLSPELLDGLLQAAENADFFRLEDLVEQVNAIAPALGQHLSDLVSRFMYDELINLVKHGEQR